MINQCTYQPNDSVVKTVITMVAVIFLQSAFVVVGVTALSVFEFSLTARCVAWRWWGSPGLMVILPFRFASHY